MLQTLYFLKMFANFNTLKFALHKTSCDIDLFLSKLHYKATVAILLGGTLLLSLKQYLGDYIDCLPGKAVPEKVANTFCYISSTYTVVSVLRCGNSLKLYYKLTLLVGPIPKFDFTEEW